MELQCGRIASCWQLAITTHSRIPIGDEATTRRVRGRFMMESTLYQRTVRMERIGTFRFQLFDHHFDMLNAELRCVNQFYLMRIADLHGLSSFQKWFAKMQSGKLERRRSAVAEQRHSTALVQVEDFARERRLRRLLALANYHGYRSSNIDDCRHGFLHA
jgi:hypothetical protein